MANLPHEIVFDILSKLPVKSLCRFKCVSKPWRILITSSDFIQIHRNKTQKFSFIVFVPLPLWSASLSLCSADVEQFDNANGVLQAIELEYPFKNETMPDSITIFGSCNGLILITLVRSSSWATALLFNPCTREFKDMTEFFSNSGHGSFPSKLVEGTFGFGYAPAIDDYRVVKITKGLVSVYSLRTSSLTGKVQKFPYNKLPFLMPGTPLNGAVHWVVSHRGDKGYKCAIAAFDLAEEMFTDLPFPDDVTGHVSPYLLGVLDGCICLTHFSDPVLHTKFWMMKEYGVKESWVKIEMRIPHIMLKPMCLLKNGKDLLVIFMRRLVLCNLENGICEDVIDSNYPPLFWDI